MGFVINIYSNFYQRNYDKKNWKKKPLRMLIAYALLAIIEFDLLFSKLLHGLLV